ncbi:MAG: YbeD family protein [Methylophilaceae bacterium]
MADLDNAEPQETLIEFPCDFPIKVMGETHDDFSAEIIKTIRKLEPKFDARKVELRASSAGKYTSLTCTCYVESKQQLDNIYLALTSHPLAKYVL